MTLIQAIEAYKTLAGTPYAPHHENSDGSADVLTAVHNNLGDMEWVTSGHIKENEGRWTAKTRLGAMYYL